MFYCARIFLFLFLLPSLVFSAPYQPQRTLTIHTIFFDPISVSTKTENNYSLQPRSGHFCFFPLSGNSLLPLACLFANKEQLTIKLASAAETIHVENNFYLRPGFPLPLDILPVNKALASPDSNYELVLKKKAAGSVFKESYQIKATPVSSEYAMRQGWLKQPVADESLYSVTARSRGRIRCMQLWKAGDDWWLYEETRFRKSWRDN